MWKQLTVWSRRHEVKTTHQGLRDELQVLQSCGGREGAPGAMAGGAGVQGRHS